MLGLEHKFLVLHPSMRTKLTAGTCVLYALPCCHLCFGYKLMFASFMVSDMIICVPIKKERKKERKKEKKILELKIISHSI